VADRRNSPHELPNYQDVEWAVQHFDDLGRQKPMVATDHLEWQNAPFTSETVNISNTGIRNTVLPSIGNEVESSTDGKLFWMFGGSTMFGWGSSDSYTIPSILASSLSAKAVNFGTPSYVALQSLIRLISEYGALGAAEDQERVVVFLDGANDVQYMCRIGGASTLVRGYRLPAGEPVATDQLDSPVLHKSVATSPRWLVQPFLTLVNRIRDSGVVDSLVNDDAMYTCDDRPERAEMVATALVSDWVNAQAIAEQHGDRFLAVLQPVMYLSQSRKDLIPEFVYDHEWAKQFNAVYPRIRRLAKESGLEFLDLTKSLDQDEYYYIDAFHLSPSGNIRIVEDLTQYLARNPDSEVGE
jgi:hypothetical protein